jgi:hypothetical protein
MLGRKETERTENKRRKEMRRKRGEVVLVLN